MVPASGTPYWRLSSFYLFYFASLGALVPYWSVYLQSLGYNAREIGELVAILMATKVVAPNVWGWIADHFGRHLQIIRLASLGAALSFAGVFVVHGYWSLALVMVAFSFFWNAALPQFEAVTMNHLGEDTHRYPSIRLWGSIGFILTVAGLGPVLEGDRVAYLPGILLCLFMLIWLVSLRVPDSQVSTAHDHPDIGMVLRQPHVLALFAACFLMQAGHGPYYTFFTIYLEQAGYSRSAIGQLWALGVIAEIVVFLAMSRWIGRFGARNLMLASLALTVLRWLLIAAFPEYLAVLIFAQILHAASFGVYHTVAIHLIHRLFRGRHQGRGQALYSSVSFGAGGAAGSLLAGYLWAGTGPGSTFVAAAGLALLAFLIAWRAMRWNAGEYRPDL